MNFEEKAKEILKPWGNIGNRPDVTDLYERTQGDIEQALREAYEHGADDMRDNVINICKEGESVDEADARAMAKKYNDGYPSVFDVLERKIRALPIEPEKEPEHE